MEVMVCKEEWGGINQAQYYFIWFIAKLCKRTWSLLHNFTWYVVYWLWSIEKKTTVLLVWKCHFSQIFGFKISVWTNFNRSKWVKSSFWPILRSENSNLDPFQRAKFSIWPDFNGSKLAKFIFWLILRCENSNVNRPNLKGQN